MPTGGDSFCEGGEPVGMAYGHPLGPGTGRWDELAEPVSADMRREGGQLAFWFMELVVRGPWRGRGLVRRLHEVLLDVMLLELR
ncbi:hypothetical protein ACIO87_26005 [Streptomyces sp. NPDC087218]|uniref:hypothetical protein n=1 Tax=Streptomyces sp. NPDC087218 TaxID=3365769 RepID=UPI0037F869A4